MRATGGRMPPPGAGSALRSSFYPQTQAAGRGWLPSLSSWIWTCRPTSAGSSKKQESSRKTSTSALLTMPKPLCGSQQTVENPSRNGNTRPPHCLLRNLYTGQEATVRIGHGTTDWFQDGKGVRQGCILSRCRAPKSLQIVTAAMKLKDAYSLEEKL